MRILFLAPQPFHSDRGTPIDIDLALRVLSERGEQVDVLTYPLGRDVHYPGVSIHRVWKPPFIRDVPPGFSMRKVLLDFFLVLAVIPLFLRGRHQVAHAVEESVYIALLLKALFHLPYVYDMDSSLSQQMIDRYPRLFRPFRFLLEFFEGMAARNAAAVVPVCDALGEDIEKYSPGKVAVIRDISLITPASRPGDDDLRRQLGIQGPLLMYVGNLALYQGVDLLLESFALALQNAPQISLVVIGGDEPGMLKYEAKAQRLGISGRVFFTGPRPVDRLAEYLVQADILVSPRISGSNTPMKIYSYLHSGRPLLATDLLTHTQVLTPEISMLAAPNPQDFATAMLCLVEDASLRSRLGQAARQLVSERHTYPILQQSYNSLYDWLAEQSGWIAGPPSSPASPISGSSAAGAPPSES